MDFVKRNKFTSPCPDQGQSLNSRAVGPAVVPIKRTREPKFAGDEKNT
jgi:hypothetical protein